MKCVGSIWLYLSLVVVILLGTGQAFGRAHLPVSGLKHVIFTVHHPRWEWPGISRTGGLMAYRPTGPTFDFSFRAFGLKPRADYTLAYCPAPWPAQDMICLGRGLARGRGLLKLEGSLELNTDLPLDTDAHYPDGAAIRLVLTDDLDCTRHRMTAWHPGRYLYAHRLIHYTDTNLLMDVSGDWCLQIEGDGSTFEMEMALAQTGDVVSADIDGLVATGTIEDREMTLTVDVEGDINTLIVTFAPDGRSFSGSLTNSAGVSTAIGSSGRCVDYTYPEGEPACILPVQDTAVVNGGQQYHSISDGVQHTGLDFGIETDLTPIVAPCDGVVTEINRHAISADNIIFSVIIKYNHDWQILLAFEPFSPDPAIADEQAAQLFVQVGDVVHQGDVIGRLVVPEDPDPAVSFPHVHWGIDHMVPVRNDVCPRQYTTPEAGALLDALYGGFVPPLWPVCCPDSGCP